MEMKRSGVLFTSFKQGLAVSMVFVLGLGMSAASLAQTLAQTTQQLAGAKLYGQTRLRVIVHVYDAGLYVPAGFNAAKPYATPLALVVSPGRAFRAETVVKQLGKELARQPNLTPAQVEQFSQAFAAVMPALEEDVPLTGVYTPGAGWALFHKGAAIGKWADEAFAKAFFDIWLGANVSQSTVKQELLRLP